MFRLVFALVLLTADACALPAQQVPPATVASVRSLLEAGQWQPALDELSPALKAAPGNVQLWLMQAVAQEKLGRPAASLQSFDRALHLRPDFVAALQGAAQVAYQMRDPRARVYLERLLTLQPGNAPAHAMSGALAFEQNDCERAVSHFEQAQALVRQERTAAFQQSQCLLSLRRAPAAVALLRDLYAATPQDPVVAYNFAFALHEAGQDDECIQTLEQMRAGNRLDGAGWNLLGSSYARRNRFDEAVNAYREACTRAPRDPDYYIDFARLAMDHSSLPVALAVLDAGLQNLPQSAALYTARGSIYASAGQNEKAAADFERATALSPSRELGPAGESLLLITQSRTAEAERLLRERLRAKPQDEVLHFLLADALLHRGATPGDAAYGEAERHLRAALATKPDFPQALTALGKMLVQQQRAAAAVPLLDRALHLDRDNRVAMNQLVLAYRQLGQADKASSAAARLKQSLAQARVDEVRQNRLQLAAAP